MRRLVLHILAGAATLAAPAAAWAQVLGQGPETVVPAWRVAAALGICLVLALAGAFALRARLKGGGFPLRLDIASLFGPASKPVARQLEVMERVRLSPQLDVCLLRCENRRFLVAASASGATLLSEIASAGEER